MSPLTSTQTYVFAGEMQLGEELIHIALEFQGDSVRLRHADTVIGSWPRAETELERLSPGHYRVTAEGDSISFHPYEATEFAQFLSGTTPGEPHVEPPGLAVSPDDLRFDTIESDAPFESEHPDWANDIPLWNSFDEGSNRTELPDDTASEPVAPDAVHGPNPARPVYPPNGSGPVHFSSPPSPAPVVDHTAHHPWQHPVGRPAQPSGGEPGADEPDQPFPMTLSPVPGPSTESRAEPPLPTTRSTEIPPAAQAPATGEAVLTPEPESGPTPPDPVPPEPEPALSEPEPGLPEPSLPELGPVMSQPDLSSTPAPSTSVTDPVDEAAPPRAESSQGDFITGAAAALLERVRNRIASTRSTTTEATDDVAPPPADHHDQTSSVFDDTDNLRQWAMVSVVGLAVMGLLAALVWGALSLFGGDESTTATTTVPTTASSVAGAIDRTPATVAAPPVTSPDTTVAENQPGFIEQWNRLATAYAYNLAIDADGEPVSTDVTANIHLSFDKKQVLTLDMTPVGNGSDRDILVAMGMAVAWAEPDLTPSARKDLLGSLGINIDSPKLADIGGELSRPGYTYRASVIDGIIRFQVAPTA